MKPKNQIGTLMSMLDLLRTCEDLKYLLGVWKVQQPSYSRDRMKHVSLKQVTTKDVGAMSSINGRWLETRAKFILRIEGSWYLMKGLKGKNCDE